MREFTEMLDKKAAIEAKGGKMTYCQMMDIIKDYRPEQRFFTSEDEARFLRNFFGMYEMTDYELANLRDVAVLMFSSWYDGMEGGMEVMQSITTVIDDLRYMRKNDNWF